jgi:hypothetical protein
MAIGMVMAITAISAFANEITSATATENCTSYTLTIEGKYLKSGAATVSYSITLKPTTGSSIKISDTLPVTRTTVGSNNFNGTATQNWSKYGVTLNSTYTLTGSAHLKTRTGNTVAIVFSPTTLSCAVAVGSCLPTGSLSVLAQGHTVTSYAPNGSWDFGPTGVQMVPLEPVGTPVSIVTPNIVNSCSSNSTTGQTVCTADNTDVYLISGTTLTNTLTSGASGTTGFSGGSCSNCGVAINATTNTAVITIGIATTTPSSDSGIQFLDLSGNLFGLPIAASNQVSEDILWDPFRNLILSPNELGNYDLFQVSGSSTTEYGNQIGFGSGDSAAEDCSTGIALSSIEFTDQLYIADLTQAVFASSTWTAPGQIQTFPEFSGFQYGTDGIAVAGSSHLGIVSGEFGGNPFGVFQLPSSSGSGTPSVVDYAAAVMPSTPDGRVWNQGDDPHTVSAYVSPNNGKAYGVMANGYETSPTYLALIDLQALLSAPRLAGTHTVDPSYNLLTNNVVIYVAAR